MITALLVGIAGGSAGAVLGFILANRRLPRTLASMTADEWRVLSARVAAYRAITVTEQPPVTPSVTATRSEVDPEQERRRNEVRRAQHAKALQAVREAAMTRG